MHPAFVDQVADFHTSILVFHCSNRKRIRILNNFSAWPNIVYSGNGRTVDKVDEVDKVDKVDKGKG